jgi:hypothetical protein
VNARNSRFPYMFLDPGVVPNSISIWTLPEPTPFKYLFCLSIRTSSEKGFHIDY